MRNRLTFFSLGKANAISNYIHNYWKSSKRLKYFCQKVHKDFWNADVIAILWVPVPETLSPFLKQNDAALSGGLLVLWCSCLLKSSLSHLALIFKVVFLCGRPTQAIVPDVLYNHSAFTHKIFFYFFFSVMHFMLFTLLNLRM